jgi:hypothetical protein
VASRFYQLVVDSRGPSVPARSWAEALGQPILYESEDEVIVGPDEHSHPGLCFVPVPVTPHRSLVE